MTYEPKYMGKHGVQFDGLDPIPSDVVGDVTLHSDKVTALCPLTDQPDWYDVTVQYLPDGFLCESKSFKLWMHSFRDHGIFAESLAAEIAERFQAEIKPKCVWVTVKQSPRGDVDITARATRSKTKTEV